MATNEDTIIERLRTLKDPATKKDIVSGGLIQAVRMQGRNVQLDIFPPGGDMHLHDALADAVRRTLGGLDTLDKVVVTVAKADTCGGEAPDDTAVHHLPVLVEPAGPEDMHTRIGMAPEAGYGECGPEAITSPEADVSHHRWEDWPPVFQWEIDPADSSRESGEADVRIGEWEYEIWWQMHPSDLVYAAIQALQDDTVFDGPERTHPTGRNVVVNLVYDRTREAVVAIYGTARDFRPFVEAFRKGCDLVRQAQETDS